MKPEAFEQRERVAGSEVELDAEIRRERDTHVDRAGGFVAVDADAADTKLRLFDDADHRSVEVEDARHAGERQRADACLETVGQIGRASWRERVRQYV